MSAAIAAQSDEYPGAGYNAAADTITGTTRYHQGDDLPIVGTVIEG